MEETLKEKIVLLFESRQEECVDLARTLLWSNGNYEDYKYVAEQTGADLLPEDIFYRILGGERVEYEGMTHYIDRKYVNI